MKKNRTYIYLLAFLLVAFAAWYLYSHQKTGTIDQVYQNFAVPDTASITKIVMKDHDKHEATLERIGPGAWTVNGKYAAYQDRVDILLETIKLVQVKNPINLNNRETTIKELAAGAIKVDIYQNGELARTYFVGGETPDQLGTKMLLNGSSEPFITYIPGFNGFLNSRYYAIENDWRSHVIYDLPPSEINEVEVNYPSDNQNSFILRFENGNFTISKPGGTAVKASNLKSKRYLVGFHAPPLEFEDFLDLKTSTADSISNSTPLLIISPKITGRKIPVLKIFRKRADSTTKGVDKENWDLDKYFAILDDNTKEILIVQHRNLEKFLQPYSGFLSE